MERANKKIATDITAIATTAIIEIMIMVGVSSFFISSGGVSFSVLFGSVSLGSVGVTIGWHLSGSDAIVLAEAQSAEDFA